MYACFLLGPVRHAPIMQTRADTHRLWRAPVLSEQSQPPRAQIPGRHARSGQQGTSRGFTGGDRGNRAGVRTGERARCKRLGRVWCKRTGRVQAGAVQAGWPTNQRATPRPRSRPRSATPLTTPHCDPAHDSARDPALRPRSAPPLATPHCDPSYDPARSRPCSQPRSATRSQPRSATPLINCLPCGLGLACAGRAHQGGL